MRVSYVIGILGMAEYFATPRTIAPCVSGTAGSASRRSTSVTNGCARYLISFWREGPTLSNETRAWHRSPAYHERAACHPKGGEYRPSRGKVLIRSRKPSICIEVKTSEAVELIRHDERMAEGVQTWCDLGCGSGTFTLALAELLAPGSRIYAIDVRARSLARIPDQHCGVAIHRVVGDIVHDEFPLPWFDGMLLANALHFIQEQEALLARLGRAATRLLIVEYERRTPSIWGPYPVSFPAFRELALHAGYVKVAKLRSHPSRYGGMMYSAVAER